MMKSAPTYKRENSESLSSLSLSIWALPSLVWLCPFLSFQAIT